MKHFDFMNLIKKKREKKEWSILNKQFIPNKDSMIKTIDDIEVALNDINSKFFYMYYSKEAYKISEMATESKAWDLFTRLSNELSEIKSNIRQNDFKLL